MDTNSSPNILRPTRRTATPPRNSFARPITASASASSSYAYEGTYARGDASWPSKRRTGSRVGSRAEQQADRTARRRVPQGSPVSGDGLRGDGARVRAERPRSTAAERTEVAWSSRDKRRDDHAPSISSRLRLPNFDLRSLEGVHIPTWAIVSVLAVLVLAIVAVPARNYYKAWRDTGVLRAEYEVLVEQYQELNGEIDRLGTTEGIEEEARSRGYVYPDEEALVVTDLEERVVADPALVEEAIEQHEQNLPWYVKALDVVLGYSRN